MDIPLFLYQGHRIDRPGYLYDYVLAAQGVIKRVENSYVSADHLLAPIGEELIGLGLAPYPIRPLRLKIPRIPGDCLLAALDDARSNLGLEFVYHFHFDPNRGHWSVERAGHERQARTYIAYINQNPHGVVAELHSHNTMGAFFSPTDDGDELGGRFYGVMGRLERANPELALRLGIYGHWLSNVPALILFEQTAPFVEAYAGESYESYAPDLYPARPDRQSWLVERIFGRKE
jgi:PRTRC genetic system protein A